CCIFDLFFFFFFSSRRRHTRFSRDWSSDVCSSDLCLALEDILDQLPVTRSETDGVVLEVRRGAFQTKVQDKQRHAEALAPQRPRSEERRVGKEWRARWAPEHERRRRTGET